MFTTATTRESNSLARGTVLFTEKVYSHRGREQWLRGRGYRSQGQKKPGGESRRKAAELVASWDGKWDGGMTRGKL